jgi:adenylate cyclase
LGTEIERKFLVTNDGWKGVAPGVPYRQGYLSRPGSSVVRVRVAGEKGFLTVKGPTRGLTRTEFEYSIPAADAAAMLEELCEKPLIEKTRYRVPWGSHVWEVDEFRGANTGLVMAEVELASEDDEPELPEWIGREVSAEPRYFNLQLARTPFTTW